MTGKIEHIHAYMRKAGHFLVAVGIAAVDPFSCVL